MKLGNVDAGAASFSEFSDTSHDRAEGAPAATLCVAGMHRSGTSMVARLLDSCGVSLGPADDLNDADTYNPEGYFEDKSFVKLNEDILSRFGGGWDDPPELAAGWESSPELDPFRARAAELIEGVRRGVWGWKDPRSSLTLPFWRRLIPDLKVVVCLRNPLEVARSQFTRGDFEGTSELRVWLTYYGQILSATRPAERLVTHYRSYFQDPRAELSRLLDWLGLEVSDERIACACAHVSEGLRHHFVTAAETVEAGAADEVLGVYFTLCAEAGPVYREARRREAGGGREREAAREKELAALMDRLREMRESRDACEEKLNEILGSKSYRLAAFHWRHRRPKK